ncbi:MAG: IctB family putative bicarbonate transporter [Pseudanabaenales cyanobacterium]|nr:IctB family putative bicarbonate transporter [Pseudanabaenales cyanobacterium]
MNSVWRQITLTGFSLQQWREVSYFHRLLKPLRRWRQASRLLQWGDAIGLILIGLIFALAPFVSTTLIGVLLIACAGFWLLLTLTDEVGVGLTPIHLMVALYWGVMAAATVFSPVKAAALQGLIKLTLNLLLFLLMARVLRSPRHRSGVIGVYLLTCLIVSVYGLRQWFFGADALATWVDPNSALANTTRVYSYLGNPNLLAGYLLPAIPLSAMAIFAWPSWTQKALAIVMLLVNTPCLVLTFSRGGWLGFVAASFVGLILLVHWWSIRFSQFWRTWALPLLMAGAVAFLIFAVLFIEPLRARVYSIFVGGKDSSNNFRLNVWGAVIDMIRARPILGIGPGNDAFNKIYPLFQRPRYTALSAYSIFLETAVEAGLVGLGIFLWLVVVAFNQAWTQLQRLRQVGEKQGYWLIGAIAAQAGLLIHGLVDTIWYRPQVSTLWWLMMAIIASYYASQPLRELGRIES